MLIVWDSFNCFLCKNADLVFVVFIFQWCSTEMAIKSLKTLFEIVNELF